MIDPIQAKKLSSKQARNESLAAAHYAKGIDRLQEKQADLDLAYQKAILGGNRDQLDQYSSDQQSLSQQIMTNSNLRAHNRIAETEAHNIAQANTQARKDLLKLGEG